MNTPNASLPRLNMRLAAAAAFLAAAAVAGTAYTRDDSHTVTYLCPDGERFTVEHLAAHVRLRTGTGVFALTGGGTDAEARYTDGLTVLRTARDRAVLERHEPLPTLDCTAQRHTT